MALLRHYLETVATIPRSRYPYSKLTLLLDYTRLTMASIRYHKLRSETLKHTATHTARVMGYTFEFFSYSQALVLFEEIFIAQQYRFTTTKGDMAYIVDCGSNIGLSVIYFRLVYPHVPVLAFEPYAAAFEVLQRNMQRNTIDKVTLHNIAVSHQDAVVRLYANGNGTFLNMSLFSAADSPEAGAGVQSRRLSDSITGHGAYVKIDTEGAEYGIIDELIQSQAIQKVEQLIVECHPVESNTPDMLIDKLSRCSFSCQHSRHALYGDATDTMLVATRA